MNGNSEPGYAYDYQIQLLEARIKKLEQAVFPPEEPKLTEEEKDMLRDERQARIDYYREH